LNHGDVVSAVADGHGVHLQLFLHDSDDVSLLQGGGPASEDGAAVRGQLEEVLLQVGAFVQDVDQGLAVDHQGSLLAFE